MSAAAFIVDPRDELAEAVSSALEGLVDQGRPLLGSMDDADAALWGAERHRRLAAVELVDVMQSVDESLIYRDQGHASARVMVAHRAGLSGGDAFRLDRIRRMVFDPRVDVVEVAWRAGALSEDEAGLLAKVFANPRVRDRFVDDQDWFITQATKLAWPQLQKRVARWVELADDDGPGPKPDPSHERRDATIAQDHFSKAWHLKGSLGSLDGSRFAEVLGAYYDAETALDWERARAEHGDAATIEHLARSDAQRRADALSQMAEDAVKNSAPSVRVKRVHNLVWKGETAEELLRRWFGIPPRNLPLDRYGVADLDGNIVHPPAAFADLLTESFRRVVQTPASVTIDLSADHRFYVGLARLGVELCADECYWPGCHRPTTRCHIDHLRPAARGGPTDQLNGLPACPRHNYVKEAGYTVTRLPDGTIQIVTPSGDIVR